MVSTCSEVGMAVLFSSTFSAMKTARTFLPSKSNSRSNGAKWAKRRTVKMSLKLLIGILRSFSSSRPTGVRYSTLRLKEHYR